MRAFIAAFLVFIGISCFTLWLLIQPQTYHLFFDDDANTPQHERNIDNGRLLFTIGGCASCHMSPGASDRTQLGGGFELVTQFGNFYPPNISPDSDYGIGRWSEQDFIRALREGVSPSGASYYPAFPYTSYRRINADDLADLFAYIKTLSAMPGQQPSHSLNFPYNMRAFLSLWRLMFLHDHVIKDDPTHNALWNRGRYLVEGPGHCAECHSPRAFTGAIIPNLRLSGGPDAEGKGWVPNITSDASGIGSWSVEDIAELLKSGFTPDYDSVGGSMADVIKNTSQLSDADRLAMATYIKSLPPIFHAKVKKQDVH
jgi:mono/diheme cytochrome c family protein